MKTKLNEQIGLFGILILFVHLAYTQSRSELLLPYLQADSLAANTTINKNLKAAIPLQPHFQKYVHHYLNENAAMLEHIKENNTAKFATIQKILVKNGIPAEMMYLAVIESELKNSATSHVGAAGIWQLMPETATTFGLKVNRKNDERRQTSQSSIAAAAYLTELYNQFDDWLLVVAAYNCGAGKVFKAIKQSGSRDFWKLQAFLPAESRCHVKHFIATHFYYEKTGSIVTITKKERVRYLASLNEIAVKKAELKAGITADSSNQSTSAAALVSLQ